MHEPHFTSTPLQGLPVRILQNPSADFTELDGLDSPGPDLVVSFTTWEDQGVLAHMRGRVLPVLRSEHSARLPVRPSLVRAEAARLCHQWNTLLVHHTPLDADRRPAAGRAPQPYATLLDLHDEPPAELLAILGELADDGAALLFDTLLGGPDPQTVHFRRFLAEALADEGLRVRFDSDLFLPWPMLCLPGPPPTGTDDAAFRALFARFLGHRHQLDQTGGSYPLRRRTTAPRRPVVSLNHDTALDRKGETRATDLAQLLASGTEFVERTSRTELLDALSREHFDEQLMYFWCHGHYVDRAPEPPRLVIRLSDGTPIDAQTVARLRRPMGEVSAFRPFILLNACHAAGPTGAHDRADLGRVLIRAGASGVLGPQIEMPKRFGAEYALAFVRDYLDGTRTAGETVHHLARHFADRYRNPLGLAYALHCGMDSRLERAPAPSPDHGQEATV
ncbi:hypothetical protein GCM10010329_03620 [Streptomyces spiroverticillatus]|uniref:CHAT domain-containing protein n=1 Tax=Streptomyces finlayi TaxID=67296 RepID=A0A918WSF2_9ACTN|nr:CHAT domain-containing protein [Streptomyces finlayi]GGZ86993.1 hypothetical protein GCM10010329_03620 [Streptomyces spiroverticillatus]GHC78397.1 hypothetical protein GCM10010334_03600 [Streptomyces finlayi]